MVDKCKHKLQKERRNETGLREKPLTNFNAKVL